MNFNFIGDIFFPPSCVACGNSTPRDLLCTACRQSVGVFETLFCGICTARLPEGKKICHKDTPFLLGAAAPYDDDAVRALIHALKFQGIAGAAEPLAEMLGGYAARVGLDFSDFVVTPVPLSEKRARARGFNQSALIAQSFARARGLSFKEHLLVRILHRRPQSDTEDIVERRENVRNCFAAAKGAAADIQDRKIILIDDVVTSGTTFTEAARVLKTAGAKKIFALAVAKA